MDKNTLYINIWGGPGISKSTQACLLTGMLKIKGFLVEYVNEYPKDLVWEERYKTLSYQPYISANQIWKQERIRGKVDIAITDSPILLGLIYSKDVVPSFPRYLIETFDTYRNLNFLLIRDSAIHKFHKEGRNQNEEEASEIDSKIKVLLDSYDIPYFEVGVEEGLGTTNKMLGVVESFVGSDIGGGSQ